MEYGSRSTAIAGLLSILVYGKDALGRTDTSRSVKNSFQPVQRLTGPCSTGLDLKVAPATTIIHLSVRTIPPEEGAFSRHHEDTVRYANHP